MSVLQDDVQLDQYTARNTKVMTFRTVTMRGFSSDAQHQPLNKPSGSPLILTLQSMVTNEYDKSRSLVCIHFLWRALLFFLGAIFWGLQLIHVARLSATCARCTGLKVKTLFNDAFKWHMQGDACWPVLIYDTRIITESGRYYFTNSVNFLQSTWIRPQKIFHTKILEVTSVGQINIQ